MKYLIAAAAVAAVMGATPALADEWAPYANLSYSNLNSDDVNLQSVGGRLGFRADRYGVEGEANWGVGKEDVGGAKVKLDGQYTVYGVAFVPGPENVEFLGRLGYGRTNIKASAGGYSASVGDNMWAVGVGAQWFPNGGKNGVRADVTYDKFENAGDATVISLSYVRKLVP